MRGVPQELVQELVPHERRSRGMVKRDGEESTFLESTFLESSRGLWELAGVMDCNIDQSCKQV